MCQCQNRLIPSCQSSPNPFCFLISSVSWIGTVSIQRYLLWTGNLTEETAGPLRNMKWNAHSGKPKQNWKFRPFAKQPHAKNATEKGFGWLFCFLQSFKKCNTYLFPALISYNFFFLGMMQNLRHCLNSNSRLPVMLGSPDFHYNSEFWGALK